MRFSAMVLVKGKGQDADQRLTSEVIRDDVSAASFSATHRNLRRGVSNSGKGSFGMAEQCPAKLGLTTTLCRSCHLFSHHVAFGSDSAALIIRRPITRT